MRTRGGPEFEVGHSVRFVVLKHLAGHASENGWTSYTAMNLGEDGKHLAERSLISMLNSCFARVHSGLSSELLQRFSSNRAIQMGMKFNFWELLSPKEIFTLVRLLMGQSCHLRPPTGGFGQKGIEFDMQSACIHAARIVSVLLQGPTPSRHELYKRIKRRCTRFTSTQAASLIVLVTLCNLGQAWLPVV